MVGDRLPQRARIDALVAVGAELGGGEHVRAQGHQDHQAHQRVPTDPARAASVLAAEEPAVLVAVRDPQRGAVDPVERQATPPVGIGTGAGPVLAGAREQPLHRIWPESCPRLDERAGGDGQAAVAAGQRHLELAGDLRDRQVAKHRHPQDQPDDPLGGEPTTAQGHRAGVEQRLLDPHRIEVLAELGERRRRRRRHHLEGLAEVGHVEDHDRSILILDGRSGKILARHRWRRPWVRP
jgi:hypothetical protein